MTAPGKPDMGIGRTGDSSRLRKPESQGSSLARTPLGRIEVPTFFSLSFCWRFNVHEELSWWIFFVTNFKKI